MISLTLNTIDPDSPSEDLGKNFIHVSAFGKFWSIPIPEIVKPRVWQVQTNGGSYDDIVRKRYGVTLTREAFHFYYGIQPGSWSSDDPENSDHVKVFFWPWGRNLAKIELLRPDGSVFLVSNYKTGLKFWSQIVEPTGKQNDADLKRVFDLTHITKDGRVQRAKITLRGERFTYRMRCAKWFPLFGKTIRYIDCESDIELGERAGEWKGGLMGWGTEWVKGETMEESFWRWYNKWNGR